DRAALEAVLRAELAEAARVAAAVAADGRVVAENDAVRAQAPDQDLRDELLGGQLAQRLVEAQHERRVDAGALDLAQAMVEREQRLGRAAVHDEGGGDAEGDEDGGGPLGAGPRERAGGGRPGA